MKKNSLIIISFISLLLIFFFYVIVKNDDIFLFTLGLSLFMILVSLFSHIDVLKVMKKYSNREYYYTRDKIFKICLLIIVGIGLILVLVTVLLSLLLENIMHIDNMLLVMTVMSINVIAIPLLRLLKSFLVIHNFKTLSKYIIHIYIVMIDVYVLLVSYISFVKLKLPSYISITGLFMAPLTILCLLFIVVMVLWYMKNKGFKKKYIIKREEVKIDIKKDILIKSIYYETPFMKISLSVPYILRLCSSYKLIHTLMLCFNNSTVLHLCQHIYIKKEEICINFLFKFNLLVFNLNIFLLWKLFFLFNFWYFKF